MVAEPANPLNQIHWEHYAQLLKSLHPLIDGVAFYAPTGACLWTSGASGDAQLDQFAQTLVTQAHGKPDDLDGRMRALRNATAYGFLIWDRLGQLLVTIVIRTLKEDEPPPPALLVQLVRPLLLCLKQELSLHVSMLALSGELTARDRDLKLLAGSPQMPVDSGVDADELGRLLQQTIEHFGCTVGALIIPERAIALIRTRHGESRGAATQLVTGTHRHLMHWVQLKQQALTFNQDGDVNESLPPAKIVAAPVRHPHSRVVGFLAFYNPSDAPDFDRRQRRLMELLTQKVTAILVTHYDLATGLLVRSSLEQQVVNQLAQRAESSAAALIYMDIDQLHVVNENYGMHVGDEVITAIAQTIRRRAPIGALCARISGDRFAIFLASTNLDEAAEAADEIRMAAAELMHPHKDGTLKVTVSAGVAALPADSQQPLSHALATAEIAAKMAKSRGRNRTETFDIGDSSMLRRLGEVQIIPTLRNAIASGRFALLAQPMLPLAFTPGAVPRFEILIRLISNSGEQLPPSKFLPAAEHYQLMPAIDRWVIERTLRELSHHASLLKGRMARFSINLSSQSIADPEMAAFIESRFVATGLAPETICFELTETVASHQLERATRFMSAVRKLGSEFALDDFGSGSSSLADLHNLPVSVIKIDGTLVRSSLTQPRAEAMVGAISQLAKSMDILAVAKSVETPALQIRMESLGVAYGQGFEIGKPVPLSEVLQDLALYEFIANREHTITTETIVEANLPPPANG